MSQPQLYVATYHYVRDLPRTRFPKIKGLLLDSFRQQVSTLPDLFEMATVRSTLEFLNGTYQPKRDLCLMTFDDGLKEHYADVTGILAEAGIQGVFFLITGCIEDHAVAPVHMNHFLMAGLGFAEYQARFTRALEELGLGQWIEAEIDVAASRHTYPLDELPVAQFKYLFNFLLPAEARDLVVRKLFVECIGKEDEFSKELYLSWPEAREMQRAGMVMGGHTHDHRPLAKLTPQQLDLDLEKCSVLIRKNLDPQQYWPFSYPYGKANSFNEDVIGVLRRLGFHFSLCTEKGMNLPGADLFAIRRLDCNDIVSAACVK